MSVNYLREIRRLTELNDKELAPVQETFRAILRQSWTNLNGYEPCDAAGAPSGAAPSSWYDHALYFKQALVLQPYAHTKFAWTDIANITGAGLRLHFPPNPFASFHFPGETLFLVITPAAAPSPKWLPCQIEFREFVP